MTTSIMSERVRQVSASLLVAASALAFGGCATATPAEQQPKAPDFSCRTQPTAGTTGKVAAAALLGAVLDKATGGGKGLERAMGEAADANLHKKCPVATDGAASSPAPAVK